MHVLGHKSLIASYLFFLTPLTILLNSLHTVEDASVLLQFLPSVDSWRLKSCSIFWFAQRYSRMDFNSLISNFCLIHFFMKWSACDLRDIGMMKMETENYFSGWTCQPVQKKENFANTPASLKLSLISLCLIYLETFEATTSFSYSYFESGLYIGFLKQCKRYIF